MEAIVIMPDIFLF